LAVLFGATLTGVRAMSHLRGEQQRKPAWSTIPYGLAGWRGENASFDPIYGADPADSSLLRTYSFNGKPLVIVYVGFYSNLATILDVHTPELCYPAQGWTVSDATFAPAALFRGSPVPAKQIVADKSGTKRLVMWWYNAGSRPFENRIRYVYAMLAMSTFTGRTDGSMVRIETPIATGGETDASSRIEEFRKVFLPSLERALP
jgi:EpsI family protein